MGLRRHLHNRTLQVVVDAPAAGITKVASTATRPNRAARRAEIDSYVKTRKADRQLKSIQFIAAVEVEKDRLKAEQAKAQAEYDTKLNEEIARLKADAIIAAEQQKVIARENERKAHEAAALQRSEDERRTFEALEAKERMALQIMAEVSEEKSRLAAQKSLGSSPSKGADEPAPTATKTASSRRSTSKAQAEEADAGHKS